MMPFDAVEIAEVDERLVEVLESIQQGGDWSEGLWVVSPYTVLVTPTEIRVKRDGTLIARLHRRTDG